MGVGVGVLLVCFVDGGAVCVGNAEGVWNVSENGKEEKEKRGDGRGCSGHCFYADSVRRRTDRATRCKHGTDVSGIGQACAEVVDVERVESEDEFDD